MPTALVTGANGFIGSHLVRALLANGVRVRCLVRRSSDLSSLSGLPVELVLGDLCDPASLRPAVQDVDYVYHLGAALMVCDRETFQAVNTQGTRNLLEALASGLPAGFARFVYVSSLAAAGPSPSGKPLTEADEARPMSWYGESKRDAEAIVREFGDRLPVTIVRPGSVYGERERDVAQAFPAVRSGLRPRLGLRTRRVVTVHVRDLVAGIIAAAASPRTVGETYFLNHPSVLTATDVTKAIGEAMSRRFGLPVPVPTLLIRMIAPFAELPYQFARERPAVTRDKAREVSQLSWVADPSKAKDHFGWAAADGMAEGLRPAVAAFLKEQRDLREMAMETGWVLWLKFVAVATVVGAIVEVASALNGFYTFTPWWAVFVIVFGAFGLGLGSASFAIRRWPDLWQFLLGSAAAAAVEAANELHLLPISWEFAPGWPFGITNPWLRSLVLGLAGGVIVLIVNALMRAAYRQRLRQAP